MLVEFGGHARHMIGRIRTLVPRPHFAKGDIGSTLHNVMPGIAVSILVAITAQFLAEHYGMPAMLMALLIGLALNFLAEPDTRTAAGVAFSARTILRVGVALLGARVSAAMVADLGFVMVLLVMSGVICTILFSLLVARLFGHKWSFALLSGGAVAICGASAAMAIASVLPRHDKSERDLAFTVLSVTLLSTFAMIVYPIIALSLAMTPGQSGVFLGGTIHDVAQVVGAGFSVSPEVGETATLVKLIRVSMLVPVVLSFSLFVRYSGRGSTTQREKLPLLPGFVVAFLALAGMNSVGLVPSEVSDIAGDVSQWALSVAIAAVGIKTSLKRMLDVGAGAIGLLIAETLFLAVFVIIGMRFIA